jgi:thiol-disulfide isomerase/thioredoxin
MFRFKIIALSTVFLLLSNFLFAQYDNLKPLKPGDTIPDLSFNIRTGDSYSKIRLSDFKGKAVLLDFWGVDCGTCVGDMPKMLDLQNKFKNDLQIIVVTPNSAEEVDTLWKQIVKYTPGKVLYAGLHLPFILSDTVLKKLFPYHGVPMHIWIDRNQVFRGAATDLSTTAENIYAFLNGQNPKLIPYQHISFDGFNSKDWIQKRIGFSDHLLNFTLISKFDEKSIGLKELTKDTLNNTFNFLCVNRSIIALFKYAYFKGENSPKNYIFIRTKDHKKLHTPEENSYDYSTWKIKNLFCYASKTQVLSEDSVYLKMSNDLANYFHLKGHFGFGNMECLALKRIGTNDKIKTKGETPISDFINLEDSRLLNFKNGKISEFLDLIWNDYVPRKDGQMMPVLDETHYHANIDIEIPFGGFGVPYSLSDLNKSLKKYDLVIVKERRNFRGLILTDAIN